MIKKAFQLTVFVKDQEEAKAFYTEKLGFVIHHDEEFSPGWRYVTVAPQKSCETMLELVIAETPEQEGLVGRQAAGQVLIMFHTDNIEEDYRELQKRGVKFLGKPQPVPGGKGVAFEDLYGNHLDMFEPTE
ncbi:VOC family protein [Salipaludibacillus sp. HK11]|uniref:VOC family protein n=1 Tax=Salipaludibacillus sp. HK11 TaxID=3394320 RepID=UPI0039FC2911